MTKIEIRGPSGIGDAIYMNSIVQEFARRYDKVLMRTKYPEIFKYCERVEPIKFTKGGADKEFNYGGKRRADQTTTQWQDLLMTAGLPLSVPYKTAWKIHNKDIENEIRQKTKEKKIFVLSVPHTPFDRLDKFGLSLIPNYKKFIPVLSYAKENNYFIIQIGKGKCLYDFGNLIDLDLKNKTTISGIMDLGMIGDVFLGQCGFILPLAEGYKKAVFIILARKGLNSNTEFLRNITGKKVCSTDKSFWVADDQPDDYILQEFKKCL